jgi:N-dimethylarginine dimethylaminohydrolase
MEHGGHSEVGTIQKIVLKHPKEAFISNDTISKQWQELNYKGIPDLDKAIEEYEEFVKLLKQHIPELYFLPTDKRTGLDSLYVHDPVIMSDQGAILCNMGKEQRRGEAAAMGDFFQQHGIPILGTIRGKGRIEGGDVVWLDQRTIAVGRGYRTNDEGIRQLKNLLNDLTDESIVVPLPHWEGPGDVLHLMSFISPIDYDLALVYSRLMPVPFREWLLARGMKLVEVPDEEYPTMACNVLAVAPRKCIMLKGNPRTKKLLESKGVTVWEYEGEEISRKGEGGPTCLTRPILRE